MPKYRINGSVTVSGSFFVELPEEEIERYLKKTERDGAEVLQLLTDGAFDVEEAELDDVAVEKSNGRFVDVYFD